MQAGTLWGSASHNSPAITFWCTCSMRPWHCWQVPATLSRWMVEAGSPWGRTSWAVWQSVQTAVMVSPRLKSPSPWMLWE